MRSSTAALDRFTHASNDPIGLAEAAFAPLLSFVCSNADTRRRLGLKGASRRPDGWPAWYFWFAGVSGAYELALAPPAGEDDQNFGWIEFAVRYFPHPDEDAFAAFAPIEQATRRSTLFDRTGTPTVEAFDMIEPSLFHVATLALAPAGDWLDMALAAQDCWLETETASGAARLRRAVRGFELAAPVLDFIVAAHAYCGRRPPGGVEILREPGTRWQIEGDGAAAPEVAAEVSLLTVHVRGLSRFGAAPSDHRPSEDLPKLVLTPGQECVFRHYGRNAPPHFDSLDLATWWRAATWRLVPSGLFCGCHSEGLAVAGRDEDENCVAADRRAGASP